MKKIKGNSRSTPWSSRIKAGSNIQAALTNPPNHRVLGKYPHYRHSHTKVDIANRIIICAYVSLHYLTLNTRPGLRLQEIQECRFLWLYTVLCSITPQMLRRFLLKRLDHACRCHGIVMAACNGGSYQGTSSAPCFYRFRS
jgi:hypothetical protein